MPNVPTAFPLIAQRLFNRALMIRPEKAELIVAALASRLGIARLDIMDPNGVRTLQAGEFQALLSDDLGLPGEYRGYDVTDGVAVIPVEGTLVNKLGTLRPWSGMTGYDGIRASYLNALEDSDVRAIAFDIDSPGGEVSGCFDLVDLIYQNRGIKPCWAILTDMACSAAYAIASACDEISLPRTGFAGSVGACTMHVDWSKALSEDGIGVTLIFGGAHKVDGNPYQPLPADVRDSIQSEIDTVVNLFVETVARNRDIPADKIRATEARVYMGQAAVDVGLADQVEASDEAFEALLATLKSPT
ncbi:S49 family peptidase [Ferrovibrio xuzhouensis]|uniref:S49 family peptidase n=1 Tax=Ferrovibrio xuzhouensis TaxID=1576914 RepID=A0ABV7VER8_9PROT